LLHKSGAKRRRHLLGFAFRACRAVAIGRNSDAGFCHRIDRLEADIKESRLPDIGGFFFRDSDGSETTDDLTFIRKARTAIHCGLTVYYTSWW
jgi:hypothetical protein